MISLKPQALFVPSAFFALFLSTVFFRPLLPIDETRYMSVAWEMWLRGDWLAPLTVNFEPYSHKPPLLFWLINASWSVLGVSRWSGLIPIVFSSALFVYLTQALAKKLKARNAELIPYLALGSIPFLVYSTLVMFDVTLGVFVLLSLLALLSYAENRKVLYLLAMALAMGLGVLTKGPVAWLYVIFPVLLAPYWLQGRQNWLSWYGGCVFAFLLSALPVLMWLIPVLKASNPDFAFKLVWEQTAGRISGNMENAHARPVYFYLPFLPGMFVPWAFLPSFWHNINQARDSMKTDRGMRFILCWLVPVIIAFSFISGKQPHYLVPLLPGVLIIIARCLQTGPRRIFRISAAMILIGITGQFVASRTVFKKYDLKPIADYVARHEDDDWAFVRKYQGELGFLGRLRQPLDQEQYGTIRSWFEEHPEGKAVIRYRKPDSVSDFEMIITMPYRGKNIGVFKK